MNPCCCVDNMKMATADGTCKSSVNVLTCKTCGFDYPFAHGKPDELNIVYSFIRLALERQRLGLKVFMNLPNPKGEQL